jgi:hypothetical protein
LYVIETPPLEPRLQKRYKELVKQHLASTHSVAAGLRALPKTTGSFAAAQAAWRFYRNPRCSLPQLAQPLIEQARCSVPLNCRDFALLMHDWSALHYSDHPSKSQRIKVNGPDDWGYELQSALVVSDRDGAPLAPVYMGLRAADGVHSSRRESVLPYRAGLDELGRTMGYVESLELGKPAVHIVDREGDSVLHLRRLCRQQRHFLLRSNDFRRVEHQGESRLLKEVVESLGDELRYSREVEYKGRKAQQYVAETKVKLTQQAKLRRRAKGEESRRYVKGKAIELRLVVAQVRDVDGKVLAQWLLWSNVSEEVKAETLALWYYWRWRIESFYKLLKRGGHHLEQWQQESVEAIGKRLLIASQACVLVWELSRSEQEEVCELRQVLVRLSGRLMKRGVEYTAPALFAGLWNLLAIIDALDEYEVEELKKMAGIINQTLGFGEEVS